MGGQAGRQEGTFSGQLCQSESLSPFITLERYHISLIALAPVPFICPESGFLHVAVIMLSRRNIYRVNPRRLPAPETSMAAAAWFKSKKSSLTPTKKVSLQGFRQTSAFFQSRRELKEVLLLSASSAAMVISIP